jgi:hypothetical protein
VKALTQEYVDKVAGFFSGKRREKFLASVDVINQSLAQDAWISRGSAKAGAGFSGLLGNTQTARRLDRGLERLYDYGHELQKTCFELSMTIRHGSARLTLEELERLVDEDAVKAKLKKAGVPLGVLGAWVALNWERREACELLDAARPLPVITPIGLSPRVTATLTECNLDLDLPSIRMAEIAFRMVPAFNKDGVPLFDKRTGERVMRRQYYVKWSEGIAHGRSRFAHGGCEACGKSIPSGRFVPVEAHDKARNELVSMWLGCDCARNIFGIKDVGIGKGES